VALGRALGMAVVIEGVESEAQRVVLRLAGCSEMQGYLFARPAPREAIDELVASVWDRRQTRSVPSPVGRGLG
jgi:EAL domain-containing protein (putative c-di-GMP-specific phosphodiesterase class I)